MKKILLNLSVALIAISYTTSCANDDTSESTAQNKSDFLNETLPSVTSNGVTAYCFDKEINQVVYTNDLSQYCITNTDYTEQVTISIDGELSLNNKVSVTYTSSGIESLSSGSYTMEIIKVDGESYYLWESSSRTGILVVAY